MRQRFEQQLSLNVFPIVEVEFPRKDRHQLTRLLKGLHYLFTHKELSEKVFSILEDKIVGDKKSTGRLGMSLWEILVLSCVKLNLNVDYDFLLDQANYHNLLRAMLGVALRDGSQGKVYQLQTVIDNVDLLDVATLDKINQVVVEAGHQVVKKNLAIEASSHLSLHIRGDSYVLESDVSFPTDLKLLGASGRKILDLLLKLESLSGHRQLKALNKKWNKAFRTSSEIHRKKGKNYWERLVKSVDSYLKVARRIVDKSEQTLSTLLAATTLDKKIILLLKEQQVFLQHLTKHIDLVERRILKGETIPHSEKIFSIFEEHVEWISKGKAGKPVELGHRHLIYSDQYNFILHQKVLVGQTDKEVGLEQGKKIAQLYGTSCYVFASLSYDRGFYSLPAKKELSKIYNRVIMPKPGKKTRAEQQEESEKEYIALRHKHSGVEANINSLEHTGLGKCRNKGLDKFKNYAALGVVAHNIGNLGKWLLLLEKQEKNSIKKKPKKAA